MEKLALLLDGAMSIVIFILFIVASLKALIF